MTLLKNLLTFFIVVFLVACGSDDSTGPDTDSSSGQGMSSSISSSGTSSISISSSSLALTSNPSDGEMTDSRDGKSYKTTTIGTQVWMAENLNFETASGSYCYDNSESNCDTYGRLYTWSVAMDGAPSSSANPSGIQGVCPSGWHMPSDDEWETLASFVANDAGLTGKSIDNWTEIGQKLKSITGWTASSGISFDDGYGFSGLPGGYRINSSGSYADLGNGGHWWSSTEISNSYAYYRFLFYNNENFLRLGNDKSDAHSVRCIMN